MAFVPASPMTLNGRSKFLSIAYHQYINNAIYTFAELGLADQLIHAEPNHGLTIEEIVGNDRRQWNSQLLYRILRACVYGGIVELINDDKHFILTETGRMMTSDHPSHVRDLIRYTFGALYTEACQQMPSLVRGEGSETGVARILGGLDFHSVMSQPDQKELLSTFTGAMIVFSAKLAAELVDGVDFASFLTMVDFGGSRGTVLAQILQNYPTIQHGVVFDSPQIINQFKDGKAFKSRKIHETRWSFAFGDMFNSLTIPPADAYLLKHILQYFNDEKCLKILLAIRQTNERRKRAPTTIFIVEHIILPDEAICNRESHEMDIAMAVLSDNGRQRTQNEYKQLVEKAGFEFRKLHPLPTPHSVMEAVYIQTISTAKK